MLATQNNKEWTPFWQAIESLKEGLTFFRVHLMAFVFIPLIFSGIFYASSGRFSVSYVDSLFLCYSAMTVTGLSTINLSTITAWQQAILYLLMLMGDITIVSWMMVIVRKHFFREHIISKRSPSRLSRNRSALLKAISSPVAVLSPRDEKNPLTQGADVNVIGPTPGGTLFDRNDLQLGTDVADIPDTSILMDTDVRTFSSSPRPVSIALSPTESRRPRAVDFAMSTSMSPAMQVPRLMTIQEGVPYPMRRRTIYSNALKGNPALPGSNASLKYRGFGGIPGPVQLANKLFRRAAPHTYRKLERRLTISATTTLEQNKVPWLNFDGLVVGRNSNFQTETLSDEELEEVGGAEFRALRLLSYLIPAYFICTQLFSFILFAPWLATATQYDSVFALQPREVNKTWFSVFQVMGAYTGGGLSLVDQGMIPFQRAYLIIFAVMFVILAGNHAMPIFLRFVIWVGFKISPEGSDSKMALSFLLEHPRRCFLYLFPSHQTWFLVITLVLFSAIEWGAFGILNIGLEAYDSIAPGPRALAGLFQGLAVRASGFSIVPIASFAPSLQFLYVVMMYIAVYPVAMSIRATNVYEERSLGVYDVPQVDEDEEPEDLEKISDRRERIGRYLGWHLRRQMSVDLWWLVCGVFLVAIIERNNLLDEEKKWFDLFRVLFELVSAFGGIGLSLGFPSDNYSFVGAMRPLSKLVVIVIMVKGRHRGLPLAVDRAVILPSELVKTSHIKFPADAKPDEDISQPMTHV